MTHSCYFAWITVLVLSPSAGDELVVLPHEVPAYEAYNLAVAVQGKRSRDAVEQYRRALQLKPDLSEAHNNLGGLLQSLGRVSEALVHFKAVLLSDRRPRMQASALNNIGHVLQQTEGQAAHCLYNCHRKIDQWIALFSMTRV